ncbi:SMP-30/gluconolactonase/LRE family protein [Sciscionella sediminilitoris]|uniref:SMP-30/gluconolactonase/LRE family protein n=1 Tax=Sciscionella sediminilitoris TaxID=1445613 RepID=UPI0004DFBE68|nr:SMP-30/gluconolactonase/LRE family protein [Sciscionella sp. SE31]
MVAGQQSERELVLPKDAHVVASKLGFVEGPVLLPSGDVALVSVNRGEVYQVALDGSDPTRVVETGGGPNCVALDRDGSLWITQNGGTAMPSRSALPVVPSIQRFDATGKLDVIVHSGLNAPSDCVVAQDGKLWFTDPAGHAISGDAEPGSVRVFDPHDGSVETALDGLLFPNGLAFGSAADVLYVAETARGVVRRYRVHGPALSWDGWEVAVPGAAPDGIALDSEGWLWVAGSHGDNIVAFDEAGTIRAEYGFGQGVLVTSLCFAGDELRTLVVTIAKGGTVVAVDAPNPGLPLPVWR